MSDKPGPSITNNEPNYGAQGSFYGPVSFNTPRDRVQLPPIDSVAAQALLATLPLDRVPEITTTLPPGSRMTLRHNTLFVGRDADLLALAAAVKDNRTAAITTGIGGVGKTQLAAEFAHRYGQFFAGGVFWLSFADPAGIDGEIAACGGAGALELYTDADGLKQAEQVERVKAAWMQETPRLLIFDNCDDQHGITAEELLIDRLPRSGGCRVLVTSRRGQWNKGLGLTTQALDVLDRLASIALLHNYRDDLNDTDSDAIADIVGDLPLAIALAGSYLAAYRHDTSGVPATYLANLRKQLLDDRSMQGKGAGPSLTNHEQNVRATFALSYERLNKYDSTDALAIAALARAACLAPGEPFPRDLLLEMLDQKSKFWLSRIVADLIRWVHTQTLDTRKTIKVEEQSSSKADALRRLVELGLLELVGEETLRLHSLIATFVHHVVKEARAQISAENTLIERMNKILEIGYCFC